MPLRLTNKVANPVVRAVLRSPAHVLLSRRLLLITYTGRRTGAEHTIPVVYREVAGGVAIRVGAPESKVWWRNLRDPAPVRLRIRGKDEGGTDRAVEGSSGVEVRVELDG